ncbi:MAG: PaaI family thioesterase [Anaerolineae bacterium]|jgi:uncharacterized protein (TIGR00369 family)
MHRQPNSRYCFLCGVDNPIGLKVIFWEDEEGRVIVELVTREEYQSYPGVLHGGIICALLDETIGRTLVRHDLWAMTVDLNIRFRHPVPLGERITVIGELVSLRSRLMEGRGEIRLADGTVAATAEAKYILISDEQRKSFESELGYWQVLPDDEIPAEERQP